MSYAPSKPPLLPEQYYMVLFEALAGNSVLLHIDSPKFTIVAATPGYLQQTDYRWENMKGKGIFEAFPGGNDPDDTGTTDLQVSLQYVLSTRQTHELPIQRYDTVGKDGLFQERYWKASNKPVFSPSGEIAFILHSAEDITSTVKAKRREVQIEGIEKAYNLFMQVPAVISITRGPNHVLELVNDGAKKLWGIEDNDVLGKPLTDAIPEVRGQNVIERFDEVMHSGNRLVVGELPVTTYRGGQKEDLFFDVVYQPFFEDDSKTPSGIFAISHDVTELVRAKRKVEESEERFRSMADELQTALEQVRLSKEAAELGTFDMNMENNDMHWDDRCRLLFGISHHHPVSYARDFIQRLHPEDQERVLSVLTRTFNKSISNGDYDVEYRTIGAEDGVESWVRAKGKVYFNVEDKPMRFIGSVLDITEQKTAIQKIERLVEERTNELAQANEALQVINKELQRSNQNLEEFAHAASHDLKEPIRKIHFFTTQLKLQLGSHLSGTELRSFHRIENATERMGSLIDDLLLYSHVSQRPHDMEPVNLNEKLRRVLEDLELDITEKHAVINIANLPVIKGYRRQLQQLFQNLISNAIKYSKTDIPPHINITSREADRGSLKYYLISVRDNGIGFAQEYAEKIFQMFTRLHGKAEYSGTGVGLSIVKKVVENHNGFIEVESEPEVGSVFKIYLPVRSN